MNNFSIHAPTGYSEKTVVSPNEYAPEGRTIGYPSKFDVYVTKAANSDGSTSIVESRSVSDLIGSRLYLYHRPLVNSNGTITTISSSAGTIDTTATNARQGYIVFSSVPSNAFTVSYIAAPDCQTMWHINTLQDSIMEIEKVLGPTNLTGYPGLRNLKFGIFDSPADAVTSGVAQNAYYLPHLDRDIRISSSTDSSISATRGTSHNIQLGYKTDSVTIDATGFLIHETDLTKTLRIYLGDRTGDLIYYKGTLSGAGPLVIGGPEWSGYSGVVFSTALTGSFYSGAMLRVHGDTAVMGNVKAYGNITIVNTTGSTSTVLGDWTVGDELFVYGATHLTGPVDLNNITVNNNITLNGDLVAGNQIGAGGGGQTLIDNLDCSEVAWTYQTLATRIYPNSVIDGPFQLTSNGPLKSLTTTWGTLTGAKLPGDHVIITGSLNANAGPSGAHPAIIQVNLNIEAVTGFFGGTRGTYSGIWSPGLLDPGSARIRILNGVSQDTDLPIYSYTYEQTGINTLTKLNVFCPEMPSAIPQTNDRCMIYNPGNVPYQYIYAAGGATPTFQVSGSTTWPLKIAFDDHVRKLTSLSASTSMKTALEYAVSGLTYPATGVCYIFADSNNTDPESAPVFKARAVPFRRKNETALGEVVGYITGSTWSILETVSYRPQGFYDSSWLPVVQSPSVSTISGRALAGFTSASTTPLRLYFSHDLGPDIDMTRISTDLYLAAPSSGVLPSSNANQVYTRSMFGQDVRTANGLSGTFMHVEVGAKRTSSATSDRDASIFYLDSRLIGIDLSPSLMNGFPTGSTTTLAPTYLRLVVKRDV